MDGTIDPEDIHLTMDDESLVEKYNLSYVTELDTIVVNKENDNRLFYLRLKREDDDSENNVLSIALDISMVEQLCAHLNLFLLAEMIR